MANVNPYAKGAAAYEYCSTGAVERNAFAKPLTLEVTPRVLLVDSDPVSLSAMRRVLAVRYVVSCEQTGSAALESAGHFDPDILIVDAQLEDMPALDLLRFAHEQCLRAAPILVNRFGDIDVEAEALSLGVFDCIDQPLTSSLLLAIVHVAVTHSGYPRQARRTDDTAHALARWADVIIRAIGSPTDPKTLYEWGRTVGVSTGGLRNWCRAAGLPARRSLLFARVLRAVVRQRGGSARPENLLNVVDRRTLRKLLAAGGGTVTRLPANEEEFFESQTLIDDAEAVAVVRTALGRSCSS